jgi:hypothetical protein
MKRGTEVKINRDNLATGMAQVIGTFKMFNSAKVVKVVSDRVEVKWINGEKMWFDTDQVEPAR